MGAGAGLVPARVLAVADRSTAHATRPQKVAWARGRPAGSWVTSAAPEPPITTSATAAHTNGFRACLVSQEYLRPANRGSPRGGSAESLAGPAGIWSPSMKPLNLINLDDHYLDGIGGQIMADHVCYDVRIRYDGSRPVRPPRAPASASTTVAAHAANRSCQVSMQWPHDR